MKRLKRLFCKHNWKYLWWTYLSLWDNRVCEKCWKKKYKYNATCSKVNMETLNIDLSSNPQDDTN